MTEHASGQEHAPGLFPVPGDGVLARRADLILLCSLEISQTADDLLDLLEQVAAAGGDGRQFTDAVADALETGSPAAGDAAASVLAFGPAGDGIAVTVSGGAWADIATGEGTVRVEAGHPRMLLRGALRSPATGIRGGLSADDNGAASTDRFSRLDAGTVRAGGLSFFQGGAGLAGGADAGGAEAGAVLRKGSRARSAPAQTPAAEARLAGVPVAEVAEDEGTDQEVAEHEPPGQEISGQQDYRQGGAGQEPEPAAPASDMSGAQTIAEPMAVPEPPEPGRAGAEPASAEPASAEPASAEAWEPVFEPTAAWASPDLAPAEAPDAAQHQGTELWTPPPAPGSGEQPPGGAGFGTAEDLERDVTAPPEPYGDGGQAYPPAGSGEPFEAVLLLDGGRASGIEQSPRQPLSKSRDLPPGTSSYVSAGPIIQGVYCKNGHFDDPEALFCAICGISMNQQTLVPRPGERPPLGVLLLDDGSVFQLDSDYVIGREPSLDSSVAAGDARPLRVADDTGIVSRVHARIHLEGWRVVVTDLGSANGTRVLLPGQPADQQLAPQVPVVLATGSQVDLGGRAFRYESHRGR